MFFTILSLAGVLSGFIFIGLVAAFFYEIALLSYFILVSVSCVALLYLSLFLSGDAPSVFDFFGGFNCCNTRAKFVGYFESVPMSPIEWPGYLCSKCGKKLLYDDFLDEWHSF